MRAFVISSSQLLHPGNNPCRRLDTGAAMALAAVLDPDSYKSALQVCEELCGTRDNFRRWRKELRAKRTLDEVAAHVAGALAGSKAKNLSPEVQAGIRKMAVRVCSEEAEVIRTENEAALTSLKALAAIGDSRSPMSRSRQ